MPGKSKSQEDYENYNQAIERKAQEELRKIKEKIEAAKREAEKVGSTVEVQEKS